MIYDAMNQRELILSLMFVIFVYKYPIKVIENLVKYSNIGFFFNASNKNWKQLILIGKEKN